MGDKGQKDKKKGLKQMIRERHAAGVVEVKVILNWLDELEPIDRLQEKTEPGIVGKPRKK